MGRGIAGLGRGLSCSDGAIDLLYPGGQNAHVIEVRRTEEYDTWFRKLRDTRAKARHQHGYSVSRGTVRGYNHG